MLSLVLTTAHGRMNTCSVTHKNNPLKLSVKVIHDNLQVYVFRMGRKPGRFRVLDLIFKFDIQTYSLRL